MKKLPAILAICTALSGCSHMDANLDSAQETRNANRDAYRQEFGCTFTDDHASYRNCLLNTYYSSKPKTYSTSTNKEGKSIAIVKNERNSSYNKDTNTYKTERVIVIETEERLVPIPVSTTIPVIETEDREMTVVEENPLIEPVVETVEEKNLIEPVLTTEKIAPVSVQPERFFLL